MRVKLPSHEQFSNLTGNISDKHTYQKIHLEVIEITGVHKLRNT